MVYWSTAQKRIKTINQAERRFISFADDCYSGVNISKIKPAENAEETRASGAGDGWFPSHSRGLRSASRWLQWQSVSLLRMCPNVHQRRRGWNVTKLKCSPLPSEATVRTASIFFFFLRFLPILFSSLALQSKSPFGFTNMRLCEVQDGDDLSALLQSFLMPVGRELSWFRVRGAVWQLQFIQTWTMGDEAEKSH